MDSTLHEAPGLYGITNAFWGAEDLNIPNKYLMEQIHQRAAALGLVFEDEAPHFIWRGHLQDPDTDLRWFRDVGLLVFQNKQAG